MTSIYHPSSAGPAEHHQRAWRGVALIMLVWLADWLFFDHIPGISLALFACALALAVSVMVPHRSAGPDGRLATATLVLSLVPSLQVVNGLSLATATAGLVVFTLLIHRRLNGDMITRYKVVLSFASRLPVRFPVDVARLIVRKRAAGGKSFMPAASPGWIVPITFSLLFTALFASANPLIESWVGRFDFFSALDEFDPLRWGFWILATFSCWPFLRVRTRPPVIGRVSGAEPRPAGPRLDALFSELAVFRSLLLFNVLFGLQNGLDAAFLWGAAALPEGMTYAAYAHRGAYTLIVTALLAAGFVLFAARRGAPSEHSARVRWLLLLWTAQNALLVQYSVLRLNLYVDVYALTYWRVAAFAWMGLVFAGLVLIFAKFFWGKSVGWLIKANLICLTLVLYGAGNTNLPALIANHNVRLPEPGQVRVVDPVYLAALGPAALPAIDHVLANLKLFELGGSRRPGAKGVFILKRERRRWARQVRAQAAHWRAWGWRHALSKSYLAQPQASERMTPWQLEQL